MCRIAGIVNPLISPDQLASAVKSMCNVQQHGGPDDEGFYSNSDTHLCVGHRRLSIIDTGKGGHQPMLYSNGRYVISYNGELYNYKEIRRQLISEGMQFTSQSDTEVIIAAYAAWGITGFERFNGMFAFAIYDVEKRALILARDPSGIKPLYYSISSEGLAFASEIRAFNQLPVAQQQNTSWPVYFLAYGHLPEPVTTLKNVQPLPKGNYIVYNCADGTHTGGTFFRYAFMEKIDSHATAVDLVKKELSNAVERHLIADTPIGVFLSGGLDSSIIALLANKYQSTLNTVSLYFENKEFSEKKYQDLLQKYLHCSHQQFLLQEHEFHQHLPAIIDAMDMPCWDGINTWFISKYARQSGLKAVLSGIGGDELFGGYPSFGRIKMALMLQASPDVVLRWSRYINIKQMRRICYLSISGPVGRYLFLRGQFIPAEIAKYLDADEKQVWDILQEQPLLQNINYLTPENQVSWMELNMYMQNQLLRDADVMSMAHGIEIRVPFLDANVVNLTLKINSSVKYTSTQRKQLLIDTFNDILPEPIWNRPKMGFSFPFKDWFSNDMYNNSVNGKHFGDVHKKLKNGDIHWSQFYSLLLLQQKM